MKPSYPLSRRGRSVVDEEMLRVVCAVLFLFTSTWRCLSQDVGASNNSAPPLSAVRLSEILIKTPQPYDPAQVEEARRKAEQIRDALRQGKEFADLAKTYSDGPSADRGGDVGYFRRGSLAPSMEEVVLKMRVGDVSDVIRTKQGFVILKVTGRGDAVGTGGTLEEGASRYARQEKPSQIPPELEPWFKELKATVYRRWYQLMPKSVLPPKLKAGNLDIEFKVRRDGTATDLRIVSGSGHRELDKAAWEAIRGASPFAPFTETVTTDHLLLRIHFVYNQDHPPAHE